jgi:hypothetical protein
MLGDSETIDTIVQTNVDAMLETRWGRRDTGHPEKRRGTTAAWLLGAESMRLSSVIHTCL